MTEQQPQTLANGDGGLLPAGDSFAVWQLAKYWGCHRTHIVSLAESGEIPAIDLRGKGSSRSTLRIPRPAWLEFIEKRQVIVTTGKVARRGDKSATRRIHGGEHARKH